MVRNSIIICAAALLAGAAAAQSHAQARRVPTPPPVFVPTPTKPYHTQLTIKPLPDSEETLGYGTVGNWHIRVDLTLSGGCFANVIYDDYTYLRLSIAPVDKTIFVMVGNSLWRSIAPGEKYAIAMGFDDLEPWTADAAGVKSGAVHYFAFRLSGGDFLKEMRTARLAIIANSNRKIGSYDVRGSYAAIEKLGECQKLVEQVVDPFAKK